MVSTHTLLESQIERQLNAIDAGQRMAGETPSVEDRQAARRVLTGQASASQVIEEGLAVLEARHAHTRSRSPNN